MRCQEALNALDPDALAALCDPDIVFEPQRSAMIGAYEGYDGIRTFMADTRESFDIFEVQVDEVVDAGDNRALATGSLRIRGRGSRVDATLPAALVVELGPDDRVTRVKDYVHRDDALRALGLDD